MRQIVKESVLRCWSTHHFAPNWSNIYFFLNTWISKTHDPLCVVCCTRVLTGSRDPKPWPSENFVTNSTSIDTLGKNFLAFCRFHWTCFQNVLAQNLYQNMWIFMRCSRTECHASTHWTDVNRHHLSSKWSLFIGQQGQLWTPETWHFKRRSPTCRSPGDVNVVHLFSHRILHDNRSGRI